MFWAPRYFPEQLLHRYGTPRPLFLIGAALLMAAVAFACAFISGSALYAVGVFAGVWSTQKRVLLCMHASLSASCGAAPLYGLKAYLHPACLMHAQAWRSGRTGH